LRRLDPLGAAPPVDYRRPRHPRAAGRHVLGLGPVPRARDRGVQRLGGARPAAPDPVRRADPGALGLGVRPRRGPRPVARVRLRCGEAPPAPRDPVRACSRRQVRARGRARPAGRDPALAGLRGDTVGDVLIALAVVAVLIAVAILTRWVLLSRRGSLGSEEDRATYETLHT